jgi:hypothetical protein
MFAGPRQVFNLGAVSLHMLRNSVSHTDVLLRSSNAGVGNWRRRLCCPRNRRLYPLNHNFEMGHKSSNRTDSGGLHTRWYSIRRAA